jgi:hypothetical protein
MRYGKLFFIVLMFIFSFHLFAFSETVEDMDINSIGKELVLQLWADMKANNWMELQKQIAPGFQSIHQDGARDNQVQIELIKGLNLSEYTLSNFKVTMEGQVIIVTYQVNVEETIAGNLIQKRSSMRLSAWLKSGDSWKWIIHANLNPLKEIGVGQPTTTSPSTAAQTPTTGAPTSTADKEMVDCGEAKDPSCFLSRMNGCLPVTAKMIGSDGKTAIEITILGIENDKCHFQRKINNVLDLDCYFSKGTLNMDTLGQMFGNDKGLQKVVDDACTCPPPAGW